MELVKELIKKAIPSLSSDKMDALMARLVELGVQCEDDLILVEAPGIQDTLPLIQCRRLVKAFQGAAHLFDHASRLLGFSVQNKLAQELSKKEPGINNFLDTKGMKMGEGPVQLICGIVRYFKENPDHLFCKNEDSADAELSLPCTPCILIRGDHLFEIAVDQEVVNDHITSPIVALSYAFCLFYVYNIEYLKEMSLTLEFMQR
ncbi:hypothetical protein JOQ06_007055 [Pogonophryne albipinna]|uniref:Uncharacterized protein n=1 Tax=Pogonophryne albipinna TaxID=1090488 RepID=A0AAD6FGG6_9TELE|nr:hypothetical protein JOQ06_007055 [Pogonophryne albipinna]